MRKIKIGIISTAGIAIKSVIPEIIDLPDYFDLIGIAGRDAEKTKTIAQNFSTLSFQGYDALINYKGLEAVYIPLPNSMHIEWVKKSLEKGLHVLVEKSMGCSLEEVILLNNLAEQKGLTLIENFQFRFHSQLETIKKILAEGKIGTLRCMRSSFGFPPFADKNNIRYQKELGGGALLDAGAYPVKITQEFLGTDIEIAAANLSFDPEIGVDIAGGAYIKQRSGNLFSEIAFGFDHFYQCNVEFWGSKGKLYTNRIFTAPKGFLPEIVIETNQGKESVSNETDNHFKKMLLHFHRLMMLEANNANEYTQNINQARLLEEIKNKANVR